MADPYLSGVFGPEFQNVEEALQKHLKVQEVISQNIANAGTPGYRALTFDEVLQRAVERTDQPQVNMDEEMTALVKNRGAYTALVRVYTGKINILRTVATQGRR